MFSGFHAVIYSADAPADRAFFRDVLGFESVDAGDGWLIFRQPPGEVAFHPAQSSGRHEFFFMCSDIEATIAELKGKGVDTAPVSDEGWGLLSHFVLPGGGRIGFYQPKHPIAAG